MAFSVFIGNNNMGALYNNPAWNNVIGYDSCPHVGHE